MRQLVRAYFKSRAKWISLNPHDAHLGSVCGNYHKITFNYIMSATAEDINSIRGVHGGILDIKDAGQKITAPQVIQLLDRNNIEDTFKR